MSTDENNVQESQATTTVKDNSTLKTVLITLAVVAGVVAVIWGGTALARSLSGGAGMGYQHMQEQPMMGYGHGYAQAQEYYDRGHRGDRGHGGMSMREGGSMHHHFLNEDRGDTYERHQNCPFNQEF